MGNQPGVARMDTSDPDGTPSASRRKSGEASREQRTPAGNAPLAPVEHQGNLPEVRAVLSEIINRVDCEPSSGAGAETSGNHEDDMANRTFSPRSLAAHLKGMACLPEEGSADSTFTVETPHTSLDDEEAEQGQAITLDAPSSSCDTRPEKQSSNTSFLGDDTNKSELDLTYTTAKGSPLGATHYFNISSSDTSSPASVEQHEVDAAAAPTLNESHHQPDSLEAVPENTLELPSVLSEHGSRDVTCIAVGDSLLLPESDNASTNASGLLSPGVINEPLEPFELYDQNVNFLEPSDSRKLPDVPVLQDTNVLLRIDNSSAPSALAGSEEHQKTSDSKATGADCRDEVLTFGITDSNDNVVTTPGDASTAGTGVIPKSLGTAAVGSGDQVGAHVQHSLDKDKTEGTLPVDSEAGPEVAQFSEEEFKAAADYFKEDLEFLQKVGSSQRLGRTSLGRCSLYLFDPLARRRSEANEDLKAKYKGSPAPSAANKSDLLINLNTSCDSDLLNFSSTPGKGCQTPGVSEPIQEEQMFSEKEMSQALKYQELMFQERLLKKDQDCVRQLESVRQEVESYRSKLEESQKFCKMQEKALQNLQRDNENVLEALQSFTKDIQKERAEQEDSMQKVVKDRDQLAEDLHNMEMTFADFHRRYEKAKQVISVMKENEAVLKQQLTEANEALEKNCHMVHIIKTKTEESIEGANKEVENTKRNFEADITVLKGQLKKATMTINSLEKRLEQKNEENTELTKLYDDLLNQVKAK
ncbi:uncharacterized protein LOC119375706 isoform X3 [Rhipicephalus sanguineus]|uniref:Transforming acidic coiled-coil-containing protein C-terminal domain-containing protein n=1 Tax=Rhipicephalus sanguineus TaxID=34632 RepID=A0A9D4TAT9_RHISA|nr:uncharacterized protein LOC119375706 isoform X3 [Rhipicephalus sanguineus]KAH7983946.1 hypothetical protein HPB52_015679 [Rhipicephalus sanguineus]